MRNQWCAVVQALVSLFRRRMAPRSTRQTGSQRRLGGNARSFLSRYIVVSLAFTCFTGLRSDEMVTPSKRTWSLAVMVSSPSRSGGPLLPSKAEPYLEPAQRSSVLSAFNLSLLAAIQWLTSVIHISSRRPAVVMCWHWHRRYSCVGPGTRERHHKTMKQYIKQRKS